MKMGNFLCCILLMTCVLFPVRQMTAAPKYVFGADQDYPPYEFINKAGQPAGFNVDLAQAVANVMGLDIEIRPGLWSEVRRQMEAGEIDGLIGMFFSPERAVLSDFSAPYIYISYSIFVRDDTEICSFDDLAGKEVAVQADDIMHDYLKKSDKDINIVPLSHPLGVLSSLSAGKYDAAVLSKVQALYLAEQAGIENLRAVGPVLEPRRYGFAVKKGEISLLSQVNEGLSILKNTGQYNVIYDKWFKVYEQKSLSETVIRYGGIILTPLIALLAVVFTWFLSMRKTVAQKTQELRQELEERRRIEAELRKSEQSFSLLCEKAPVLISSFDTNGRAMIWNVECEKRLGYTADEVKRHPRPFTLLYPEPGEAEQVLAQVSKADGVFYEYTFLAKDGQRRVQLWADILLPNGHTLSIGHDITDRKQMEQELKYQSQHDQLTGLYSRSCYEEELRRLALGRLPLSAIVLDVDGLKLINDTMGHAAGDAILVAAAAMIRMSLRGEDFVARVGGDEFVVLLTNTRRDQLEVICQRIRERVERYNAIGREAYLSLSIGYAIQENQPVDVPKLVKEADNNMYREKLHRSRSARSAIVQTMMNLLGARDMITEGHGERLQDMTSSLAKSCGMPENRIADLRLLAQFHDIGKVGIPDRILFKPGALTPEERLEMQRHVEIGQRIALSSPDLTIIADWILKHHEWWNGNGYPLRLEGEAIPLECRIIAIADSYDAMTSDRPYRKAMPEEAAVAELKRCAGTQFDPHLVELFIRCLSRSKTSICKSGKSG